MVEDRRIALQAELDTQKSQAERNRLGQFATPTDLADQMLRYAATFLPPNAAVRFLDPAIGTGAFYSALLRVFGTRRIEEALGFEIDPHYGQAASELWKGSSVTIKLADFTLADAAARFNLVICNPPYVRHHHLQNADKNRLQLRTFQASNMKVGGLAGLYCHFIGLSHAWMGAGALAGWLVPSEFMDVNYGDGIKHYLLNRVTLLHIHRFDPNDVQFSDALVSSAVVWFQNTPPPEDHSVKFTFGGTLLEPKLSRTVAANGLARETKWTRFPAAPVRERTLGPRLADFFHIKRGVATGDNDYFILREDDAEARGLPAEVLRPILPSPRFLRADEIASDKEGDPVVQPRLFLFDTRLEESDIKARFPSVWAYLEEGRARGVHERYLCSHRSPWYVQESRPPAPIVCTYLGRGNTKRGRPFRFILNESRATVANVYLAMYPTPVLQRALDQDPTLMRRIWRILNEMAPEQLLGEGRVYGGGLHKLEPRELARVGASGIAGLLPEPELRIAREQFEMFRDENGCYVSEADMLQPASP